MIDKLISFSENEVIAGLTIPSENIFVDNGTIQESGLIEHMAQSVALFTGYQFFLKNEPAPTGYIGSIKSIEVFQLPKFGDDIATTITILQEYMGVTLVEISTKLNNIEIGSARAA